MNIPKELLEILEKISPKEWVEIEETLKNQKERIQLYRQIGKVINEVKRQSGDDAKVLDLKKKFNIK